MFKIGDFSKLSQLSVKTLRYYDEIGLLKPVEVDPFTGYRYYSAGQLPRLNRILALRDLGLSLEQIAALLNQELPAAQIRGMLRLKQAEIQQRVEEEQQRLARVAARLSQIEREGTMPDYEVVLKKVQPQRVAALREIVPGYGEVGPLIGKLFGALGRQGIRPAGPTTAIYYDPEYRERDVDVEATVPVAGPATAGGNLTIRELSGAESMASVIHEGPFEGISNAYSALLTWIEANGYRIVGPNRETYLRTPEQGTPVTEVQIPVEKA